MIELTQYSGMRKVWIRIYSKPIDVTVSHAFYVGHVAGGLTPRLASFSIFEDTSFAQLREWIEWKQDCDVPRRTILYYELLDVMNRLRKEDIWENEMYDFRFATFQGRKEGEEPPSIPAIVKKEVEDEPIAHIIDLDKNKDLILVPLVEIPSTDI